MTPSPSENPIDEKYVAGQGIRRNQTEPLFRNLKEMRKGRGVSSQDNIFDIGCGPCKPCEPCKMCAPCKNGDPCIKEGIPVFADIWIDRLLKRDKSGAEIAPLGAGKPKRITGFDTHQQKPSPSNTYYGIDFEYISAEGGFLDWPDEELNRVKGQYSLVTAINSWHWIMKDWTDDGKDFQNRCNIFFKRAELLLEEHGHLVMMHLFSQNPSPEVTTIAAEALSRVSSLNLKDRKDAEAWFNGIRNKFWKLPKELTKVKGYLKSYTESCPDSHLQEKLLLGTVTYSWPLADGLWDFWQQNNLTGPLKTILTDGQKKELETEFKKLLNEQALRKLDLQCERNDGKLHVLLSLHGVQQIIQKSTDTSVDNKNENYQEYKSHIRPDLPNTVHAELVKNIYKIKHEDPWFNKEPLALGAGDSNSVNTDPLRNIFTPIFEAVHTNLAEMYNVVLRQPSSNNPFGFYKQVYLKRNEKRLEVDLDKIKNLRKDDKLTTMSDLIFYNGSRHDDIVIFSGKNWNNHSAWSGFREDALIAWVRPVGTVPKNNDFDLNPLTNLVFEYSADFIRDRFDKNIRKIYQFFRFLLWQLRIEKNFKYKKSVTLITSNKTAEDKSNTETVNMTFYPKHEGFATPTDCFLLIDSLQTLALVRQRFMSRAIGIDQVASTLGHEIIKAYGPVFDIIKHTITHKCGSCEKKFALQFAETAMMYAIILTPTTESIDVLRKVSDHDIRHLSWRIYMLRDVLGESFSLDKCTPDQRDEILRLWDYLPNIKGTFYTYELIEKLGFAQKSIIYIMQILLILTTNAIKHSFSRYYPTLTDWGRRVKELAKHLTGSAPSNDNDISIEIKENNSLDIRISNSYSFNPVKWFDWERGTPLALDTTCRLLFEVQKYNYARSAVLSVPPQANHAAKCTITCKIPIPKKEAKL